MGVLMTALLAVQMLAALGIVALVLLQQGKGADMGAAFGGGSSGSLFGASGSANFLSKLTAACATVFFVATLVLAYYGNSRSSGSSAILDRAAAPAVTASGAAISASAAAAASNAAAPIPGPGLAPAAAPAATPAVSGGVSAPASIPAGK